VGGGARLFFVYMRGGGNNIFENTEQTSATNNGFNLVVCGV